MSSGIQLNISSANEGAVIMYECMSGFQPQETITAVCGRDGRWSPDPALHNCIGQDYDISHDYCIHIFSDIILPCSVDCGELMLPSNSNGNIGIAVTDTTEGATVSFQCEEGLFLPSGSNGTLIQCTNVGNMGQWMPSPAILVCRPEGIENATCIMSLNLFPRLL